jgi:tetratricopeptide (TPR) repeat protein
MRARSGVWYVRARALAVRAGARFEVIRAITGYGALLKDMGRVDEALVQYEDAARRAGKRYRRRCAVAKHYIFALHVDRGRFEEAVPYAVEAFDLYPARDERLPFLAHDLAYVLVRMRYHRLALHLLDATAAGMTRPHEMGLLFGTTAEAAGGARRAARYLAAERAALELVAMTGEHAGAALASLAEGARSLEDWPRAELHARESLVVALRQGDARQVEESRALLRAVLAREPAPPARTPPDGAPVAMLARRFAAHLRRASRRGTRL